jgi:hypothetical protein
MNRLARLLLVPVLLLGGSLPALCTLSALSALSVLAPREAQAQQLIYDLSSPPVGSGQTPVVFNDPTGNTTRLRAARDYVFTDGTTSTKTKTILLRSGPSAVQVSAPIIWDVPGIRLKGDLLDQSSLNLGGNPFILGFWRAPFSPVDGSPQSLTGIGNRAYDLFGTGVDTSVVTGAGQQYGYYLNGDSALWFPAGELSLGPMPGPTGAQGWSTLTKFTWDFLLYFPVAPTATKSIGYLNEENGPSPWALTAQTDGVEVAFVDSTAAYHYFKAPGTVTGLVRVSIQINTLTGVAAAWFNRTKVTLSTNTTQAQLAGLTLRAQRYGMFRIGDTSDGNVDGSPNAVICGYRLCTDELYVTSGAVGSTQTRIDASTMNDNNQFYQEPVGKTLFALRTLTPTSKSDAINERVFPTRPYNNFGLWAQSGHGNPMNCGPLSISDMTINGGAAGYGAPVIMHHSLYTDITGCRLNGSGGAAALYLTYQPTQYVTKLTDNHFHGGTDCAVNFGYGIADWRSNTIERSGRTGIRGRGISLEMSGTNLIAGDQFDTAIDLLSNTQQNVVSIRGLNVDNESNAAPKVAFIRAEATSDRPTALRIAPWVGGGAAPNVPGVLLTRARGETLPIGAGHGLSTAIVDTPFWIRAPTQPVLRLDKSGWYGQVNVNGDMPGGGALIDSYGSGPGSVRAVPVPGPATSGTGGGPRTQRKAKKWRGRWRGQWRLPPGKRAA